MHKHSSLTSKILDSVSNAILLLGFFILVAVAGVSSFLLTPVSSEVIQAKNVLGVSSNSALFELENIKFVSLLKENNPNFDLREYKSDQGYIAKFDLLSLQQGQKIDFVSIINTSDQTERYLLNVRDVTVENAAQSKNSRLQIAVYTDGSLIQYFDITKDQQFVPVGLLPNSEVNLGFSIVSSEEGLISDRMIEFEVFEKV